MKQSWLDTDGNAGLVGGLAIAGLARPLGVAGALAAVALAVARAHFVVDPIARKIVTFAEFSADYL